MSNEPLFDVVAVNIETKKERHLDTNKTERNAEAILVGGLVGFFAHDEAGRILDFDHLTSQPLRVFLQPVHPSLPVAATAHVGNGLEEQSLW